MKKSLLALCLGTALFAGAASAANIVPVNADPAGQGLNDLTPIAPAGGNPGTTIGEQRRIAYQFAADLWGSVLESDSEIRVQASFQPLTCDATRTVLGSAGAGAIYILSGGDQPATLYHGALADALVGFDIQNGAGVDVVSRFNASYGRTNPDGSACSPGSGWYYGLDGQTPAGLTNFLNVVMHEIAHGLGFSGFGNVTTGAPLAGFPDVYSQFAFDNNSQRGWYEMDNAGRLAALSGNNVVFRGPQVTAEVPLLLDQELTLSVSGTASGNFNFGTATFGAEATPANFSGGVVLVNDGSALPSQGCAASPAGAYAGKVALVDRGSCGFEVKAAFAEQAGATAVIVANNAAGVISMGETAGVEATVPTLSVSLSDGNAIKAGLPGVNVGLVPIPGQLAGADANGFARLYVPSTIQPGSTFSHYDTSARPNALMEPSITSTLAANVMLDLTPALFKDEGWVLNPGTAMLGNCDTGIPVVEEGGLIPGATVMAISNVCKLGTSSKGAYQGCMDANKERLLAQGVLQGNQGGKMMSCAAKNR
ncbi:MAG: serine protease [Pseudomonadota bacterium]|nr:serine protease [Pseudomonadota bacterium]